MTCVPSLSRTTSRCALLLAAWLAAGAAWPQRPEPALDSAACRQARAALEAALQAQRTGDAASTARLERARRQAQDDCLGGGAADAPRERMAPYPPVAMPPAGALPRPPSVPTPAPPPVALPRPRVLGPCDATGCWDDQGRRLPEGGGMLGAPGGGVCSVQGVFATCP